MLEILINQIVVEERVRTTSGKDIGELSSSIEKIGLLHPITVKKISDVLFKLLSGFRRLEAIKTLGWKRIPAVVKVNVDELEEIDIEIEENIRRKNLSGYEFDIALAKRKRVYQKLHPETTREKRSLKGKKGFQKKKIVFNQYLSESEKYKDKIRIDKEKIASIEKPAERFAKATAKKLGISETTVVEHSQIGEAIMDKKFDEDTIEKYKKREIAHSEMLKRDKKRKKVEEKKEKPKVVERVVEQPKVENKCKDCDKSSSFNCAYCGEKNLLCNKYKNPLVKKLDASACGDFEN